MTSKRDDKSKPKTTDRPKLKKEQLKDLEPTEKGRQVRGGRVRAQVCTYNYSGCEGGE